MVRGRRSSTRTVIGRLPSGAISSASSKRSERKTPSRFSRSWPASMSSGSKGCALGQVRHEGDEVGIDPPAARRRWSGRSAPRGRDRASGVTSSRLVGVVGDHLAVGLARLGVGELAPALDRQRRGLVDDAGARRLAGLEADRRRACRRRRARDRGRRRVDDLGARRTGSCGPAATSITIGTFGGNSTPSVDVGDLLAGGADADLRPVVAGGVERRQQPPVVAARLGEQPARCRRPASRGRVQSEEAAWSRRSRPSSPPATLEVTV